MNDKGTAGFTFIESLVSVALVVVITLAVSTAFVNIIRHNEYASVSLQESWKLLYTDQNLREQIEPVVFPYWENSITAAQNLRAQIMGKDNIPGVKIVGTDIITKDGSAHGLIISYKIIKNSKIYNSYILFSSSGDAIKR